jgi:dTMP kinase
MASNLFIALEGIDGSGKSSQAKLLAEKMEQQGQKVFLTCEPTNGHVGSLLLSILKKQVKADHKTIALLFAADRIEHLLNKQEGVLQKLSDGYTVITDRYYFSSYAYNGTHSDIDWVIEINKMSAQILRPHVNFFIDVPPEVCMERINSNRASTELFENLDSLRNVRAKYLEAFGKLQSREKVTIINGNRPIEDISADLWQAVKSLLS